MNGVLHIASFVVHHRPEAAPRLDLAIAAANGIELALRDGGRSVLLCEAGDEYELMQSIEALRALDGVIGVSLVHHHAEAKASLMEDIDNDHAA